MGAERFLVLDYETRSDADLKKTGAYEYARHPSTRVLCVSWRLGTREELTAQLKTKIPAPVWSPAFPSPYGELVRALCDPTVTIIAHNALFEQVITRFTLSRIINRPELKEIPHSRWICTAALSAVLALPRRLEGAGAALGLPIQKDKEGHRLMLKYCKPTPAWKKWDKLGRQPAREVTTDILDAETGEVKGTRTRVVGGEPKKYYSSADELRRIMSYCQTDVDAETLIFLTVPPLSETERKVWLLDQKINFRGFLADRDLVGKVLKMIASETTNLNQETGDMTLGKLISTTQRDGVLAWLESEGVFLPDLRAKTVSDALKEGLVSGESKRMLQIRQAISKTSTKKYQAFEIRSRSDGRVRDILVYHTASTGRWGGAGVQPQNFPRGNIEDTTEAAEVLRYGDIELVRLLYGNPMDVFSSCLRSMIVAPPGRLFHCADYNAIEARVLFWMAKHDAGIRAFLEKRDLYKEMAQKIYSIEDVSNVTKLQRQVGKQSVLGCGYGMGGKKFHKTCHNFGIEIDEEIAQVAVNAYRSTHQPVVKFWSNIERASIAAVQQPGKKFSINRTAWWVKDNFLWCQLPSGRKLAYYGPEVKQELTTWGEKRPVLYHWGINPYTKKWESSGTYGGRLVENVVQATSRDFMADAMLRVEDAGYEIVLSVHDELLAERDENEGSIEEFEVLMGTLPAWGQDCPIAVSGWSGPRYKK